MKTMITASLFCSALTMVASCGQKAASSSLEASPTPPKVAFATVQPIIATTCSPCHSTTFVNNQDQVYELRAQIADYVTKKLMPPAYAGTKLSDADRATLINYVNQFPQ